MNLFRSFLCGLLLISSQLMGATWKVCPTCDVTGIKEALELAENGDTVNVLPGHYLTSNILIDKAITLRGVDYPIIDGENGGEIFTVVSTNVTIEGFQIQNVGMSYLEERAGIRIRKRGNFRIVDNRILNTFFAIYLEHASDGYISGNEILGDAKEEMSSGNGIHAWYSKRIEIRNNTISKHRDGIYFEFVDHSIIENNVSKDNLRYGLHFMFSNNDQYSNNTFIHNGAGVAVMFSKHIQMRNNVFEKNWGRSSYGLLLKEIYDATIIENTFSENTIAIYVEGSARLEYTRNVIRQNGWAIKMSGGCLENRFHHNIFVANAMDVVLNGRINDNRFDQNYWSEYSGYDLDRDGVGDVPHRPVKLFSKILDRAPEAIVLLRSFFVDLLNFTERVNPALTPPELMDHAPLMKPAL